MLDKDSIINKMRGGYLDEVELRYSEINTKATTFLDFLKGKDITLAQIKITDKKIEELLEECKKHSKTVDPDALRANYRIKPIEEKEKLLAELSDITIKLKQDMSDVEERLRHQHQIVVSNKNSDIQEVNNFYSGLVEQRESLEPYFQMINDNAKFYEISFTAEKVEDVTGEYLKQAYDEMPGRLKRLLPNYSYSSYADGLDMHGGNSALALLGAFACLAIPPVAVVVGGGILIAVGARSLAIKRSLKEVNSYYSLLLFDPRSFDIQTLEDDASYNPKADPDYAKECKELLKAFAEKKKELQKAISEAEEEEATLRMLDITEVIKSVEESTNKFLKLSLDLKDMQVKLKNKAEALVNDVKQLGTEFDNKYILPEKVMLGRSSNLEPEYMRISKGQSIYVIKTPETEKYINLLLLNFISSISPICSAYTLWDTTYNYFGPQVFYTETTKDYIVTRDGSGDQLYSEIQDKLDTKRKKLGERTIEEYNEDAYEFDKTPLSYNFYVIYNEADLNDKFKALIASAARLGEYFICVTSDNNMAPQPGYAVHRPFSEIREPLPMSNDTISSTLMPYIEKNYKTSQPPALMFADFYQRAMGSAWDDESKYWGYAEFKDAIGFLLGYVDGDPDKVRQIYLGTKGLDVHGIIAGATGSGKSVLIHVCICSILMQYSPDELWLGGIDFKGPELLAYKNVPHTKFIVSSGDSTYAITALTYYAGIMEYRNGLMASVGLENISDWNKIIPRLQKARKEWYEGLSNKTVTKEIITTLESGEVKVEQKEYTLSPDLNDFHKPLLDMYPEEERNIRKKVMQVSGYDGTLARIPVFLLIADELTGGMKSSNHEQKAELKRLITQIGNKGRSTGMLMLFASQYFEGSMDTETMDQFTARFVLRASSTVSKSLLNNSLASDIREKNGQVITRDVEQRVDRLKTPFIPNEQKDAIINKLIAKGNALGYKQKPPVIYIESETHRESELIAFKKKYIDNMKVRTNIYFGRKMYFDTVNIPASFEIPSLGANNILLMANTMKETYWGWKTLYTNFQFYPDCGQMAIDLAGTYIPKFRIKALSDIKVLECTTLEKLTKMISHLIKVRKKQASSRPNGKLIVYLFGIEALLGLFIARDPILSREFYNEMKQCSLNGVHLVFVSEANQTLTGDIVDDCRIKLIGKVSKAVSMNLGYSGRLAESAGDLEDGFFNLLIQGSRELRVKTYRSEVPFEDDEEDDEEEITL